MRQIFGFIMLLGASVSVASATDGFTTVYEWNKMDFNWPSEERMVEAVKNGFVPEEILPRFMAVFGERLFLSLVPFKDASLSSLVWLPTNATSTSPKLNPFPSWEMHGTACDKMQEVRGLKVDSDGRLWALDDGRRDDCLPKLWIFDLTNNSVSLVHQFSEDAVSHSYESRWLHDLELDQWNGDWLAYILDIRAEALVVFNLDENKSWRVETQEQGKPLYTIALSPKGNE
ncbi:Hypothetical predicted protein [Cloeon dipterum]|uniref:Bee-milk protein n=1 Tax=Cloeon dipterum TaxID=197152 RepID=A0A8S1DTP1_9INSE|nr:Hypothetical predicted protein [Cloeon dipterum]